MRVSITVKPGSREDRVEVQEDGSLVVSVRAPAERGKANTAVIKLLSRHFKRDVKIVAGFTSRHKIVEFTQP
jgi:uncharacterized protein (TIGR00251 family)